MTPKDLNQIEQLINKALVNVTRKDDLKGFATKKDLEAMEDKIIKDLANVIHKVADSLDERKSDRSDLKKLEKRIEKVEQFFPQ